MTDFTKIALADGLMKLLETKSLDKITIGELADTVGVHRQTFYYHFTDIYDLVRWAIQRTLKKYITQDDYFSLSPDARHRLFIEIMRHRNIMMNLYRGMDEARIRMMLSEVLDPWVTNTIRRCVKAEWALPEDELRFATSFISSGSIGIILEWLSTGLDEKKCIVFEKMQSLVEAGMRYIIAQLNDELALDTD